MTAISSKVTDLQPRGAAALPITFKFLSPRSPGARVSMIHFAFYQRKKNAIKKRSVSHRA